MGVNCPHPGGVARPGQRHRPSRRAILILASRQRPDGVAAVPPCPQTAVFANPGGSGVTPTEKEEAIMRIAAPAGTILDPGAGFLVSFTQKSGAPHGPADVLAGGLEKQTPIGQIEFIG